MARIISKEIRLTSRPTGLPTPDHFNLVETELPKLKDREVLVRNLFLSVDPYMRGRMNDKKPCHMKESTRQKNNNGKTTIT